MSTSRTWFIVAMVVVPWLHLGPLAGSTYALEESTPQLTLTATKMRTQDNTLGLTTTPVSAFSPSKLGCPATSGTCTIRVEVSSQFDDGAGTATIAQMQVLIDGSATGVLPDDLVNVDPVNATAFQSVRTFVWMKKGLAPGSHTVTVNFLVTAGSASAGLRTLTIQMFTP